MNEHLHPLFENILRPVTPKGNQVNDRRQTLKRFLEFLGDLHPDSPMSKILCECFDKQDCTDFGFYFMKYMDEVEAEKMKEAEND